MKREDTLHLVAGHMAGALNKSESDSLMREALEDQEVFNDLMEAEPVRQVFRDPMFRARMKAELREKTREQGISLFERFRRLLFHPAALPVGSVALTGIIALLISQGVLRHDSPIVQVALPPGGGRALTAAGLVEVREGEAERLDQVRQMPAGRTAAGAIGFDKTRDNPSYRLGDPMRIGFRLEDEANVMVIEERSDGSTVRLFPNRMESSARVAAGTTVRIPPQGQGYLQIGGPTGKRTIRVLVFPTNVDPMDFSQPWPTVRQQAASITKDFEVAP